MNYVSDILYWISTGLMVPVIVLLIVMFIRALLLIGSFFGQYLSIRKTEFLIKDKFASLNTDNIDSIGLELPQKNPSMVVCYILNILKAKESPAHLQKLLADYEIAADKDLAISKTLTKIGPMLGLMGTLIPMGPALVGLSTGDIASMAYNMQVPLFHSCLRVFFHYRSLHPAH